jgi:hypothetical protein
MAAPAAADERQHVTVPCSADDGYAVVVAADSGGAAAWELGNKGHSAPAGAADYAIGSFEGPGQFSATSTGITAAEHLATASLSWDSSLSWLLKKFKTRALVSMWLHTNAVSESSNSAQTFMYSHVQRAHWIGHDGKNMC